MIVGTEKVSAGSREAPVYGGPTFCGMNRGWKGGRPRVHPFQAELVAGL